MHRSKPPALEQIELQVEGRGYVRSLRAEAIAAPNITCTSASSSSEQQQTQHGRDLCSDAQAREEEMGAMKLELQELRAELRELKAMLVAE